MSTPAVFLFAGGFLSPTHGGRRSDYSISCGRVGGVSLKVAGNSEDGVIGHVRPSAVWMRRDAPGRCSAGSSAVHWPTACSPGTRCTRRSSRKAGPRSSPSAPWRRGMPFCKSHNFFIRYQKICPGISTPAEQILFPAAQDYLKGVMNGKTAIPTKTWKAEYAKLTAERKTLNHRYLALKEEVKEAEQIRKSVYSILRQEQREQQPRRAQDIGR